ncbi:alginate biosynthesis protein AlgZ/FimS [Noviherbaspirillum aridicola]|uniref:Alginate biosynthesis protein AlgZ/FimS n=2 Tax=Noviherbaspirillum aridicola TaxID=2849687 RepID=A0ABQ4QBI3_9BURK|nr:alginate biosynthesis protein AlgZ/FimS [Noviherbaspirillum aridicola]
MPSETAVRKPDRPTDILIPDCCNLGVVLRVLLAVNLAVAVGSLLHASGWRAGFLSFVEGSMMVELSCLWSLFALCVLRRMLPRLPAAAAPAWAQRFACVLVPAAVTAAVVHFFVSVEWLRGGFEYLTVPRGALLAALFGGLMQHYFELRTRAFSPALVEARLQALQARIRPHFLFNSLNAVLSLIRGEPRRAEAALEDLADLFRVLMSDPRNMTTLDKELRLCEQYLAIEKLRLGERLQVEWRMENIGEDVLRRAQMPVLLLQPLLENAVHYGVEPASAPAPIRVEISRALERIEVVVVNAWHGAAVVPGNQLALQNIRERLQLLYDVESQLATSVANGHFEVRLRFPYVKGAA